VRRFSGRRTLAPTAAVRAVLLCVLFTAVLAFPALAREEILSFDSGITVSADGSMTVREGITVRSEGERIRRGIYRDFPTDYRDRFGNRVRTGFTVLSASRDGRPEPFRSEKRGNGVRVYLGDPEVMLAAGEHAYVLSYRTDRQLGFFADHDELYWNATGNGWEFPILAATARVTLPPGVPAREIKVEGWTGAQGSTGRALTAGLDDSGRPLFTASRELAPGEGMTVLVGWPKGFVAGPGWRERLGWFLRDNGGVLAGIAGLLLLLLYYLGAWVKEGRDPQRGPVVPQWEPPQGLSPEAMRFVMEMGYDDTAFSAAVIDMAVKGYLGIEQEGEVFTLKKTAGGDEGKLSPTQRSAANSLFAAGDILPIERGNHLVLGNAQRFMEGALKAEYDDKAFRLNRSALVPGALITLATVALAVWLSGGQTVPALFLLVWLSVWSFGTGLLWVKRQWFMAAAFTFFLVMGLFALAQVATPALGFLFLLLAGVDALFFHLMKAPTYAGRKMMDGIEGFRMYLSAAEEDRLNVMNPPEKTPELFERYLPYALALGVSQQWSEKFAGVLARAAAVGGTAAGGAAWSPGWYSGPGLLHSSPGAFASGLGSSLSSAISSSSVAPGSSSGMGGGFGGGGSSGGGGGGGGGGGW
jgi:uncharacterized membrane protein YgcG